LDFLFSHFTCPPFPSASWFCSLGLSVLCCIKVEKVHTCLLPYLREKAFCFPSSIPW
jgi:hypothetical protein